MVLLCSIESNADADEFWLQSSPTLTAANDLEVCDALRERSIEHDEYTDATLSQPWLESGGKLEHFLARGNTLSSAVVHSLLTLLSSFITAAATEWTNC